MLYDIVPTSDNLMSVYTLITFVLYALALIVILRYINTRFNNQKRCINGGGVIINKLQESINAMAIDLAVVKSSIVDIESDAKETRDAIAEINRILIDKLR